MPALGALALLFIIVLTVESADRAARAGWVFVALAALALIALALGLWHRRRMAELHEKHLVWVGRWRNVSQAGVMPWPKACKDCGQEVTSWRGARAHDDEETSSCARYLAHREAQERGTPTLPTRYEAEVISSPGEPPEEPPSMPIDPDRAATWARIDSLMSKTGGK
jgi:hypothetical protein